jgi:hypothetical protein
MSLALLFLESPLLDPLLQVRQIDLLELLRGLSDLPWPVSDRDGGREMSPLRRALRSLHQWRRTHRLSGLSCDERWESEGRESSELDGWRTVPLPVELIHDQSK